ncbi:MAG TPA: carbohydrate binding domain-containing protein, partial [Candidatus Methylacidiphilales bacterium]|nr:carbohydrate binding domain-containing protein [Candidatus Methylacidiphilales bacterium]
MNIFSLRGFVCYSSMLMLSLGAATSAKCDNLLLNGDFENGKSGWYLFAPAELKDITSYDVATEDPKEGANCGKLNSTSEARYAITNGPRNHVCKPGDRYRLSAWVRAGQDYTAAPKTPGLALRLSIYSQTEGYVDSKAGHFMLGLGNKAYFGKNILGLGTEPVPTTWTKVEGVLDLPEDAQKIAVAVFSWSGTGSLYIDDVQL